MPRFHQETSVELIKVRKNFQVTIPMNLRRLIHLAEGDLVEAEVKDGALILRPVKVVHPDKEYFYTKEWQAKEPDTEKDGFYRSAGSWQGLHVPFELPKDKLNAFCRRWQVSELALFGSALRNDFQLDSDIDFLVTFAADTHWSLFDLATMQEELQDIVGRNVDLVERRAVEKSENYIRRRHILQSAEPIYVA